MATFAKLRSGEWGLRIEGGAAPGDRIEVMMRSGETKRCTIGRVVWSGNGVSLCTIGASGVSGNGRRFSTRKGSCWECGAYGPLDQDGMCGNC